MNLIETELMNLRAEQDQEIKNFLDKFIGVRYAWFFFLWKVIRTREEALIFISKKPHLAAEIEYINAKYFYIESVLIHEHSRIK